MKCIDSALAEKRTQMPKRLREAIAAARLDMVASGNGELALCNVSIEEEQNEEDENSLYKSLPKMPQGIRDSMEAVGPALSIPVITAICPAIGMLATGVKVDIHRKMSSLNLISYIAGDFASGKGSIDPVVEAWASGCRDSPEAEARPVERDDRKDTDTFDARCLRHPCRLSARERALLLPRPH